MVVRRGSICWHCRTVCDLGLKIVWGSTVGENTSRELLEDNAAFNAYTRLNLISAC